MELTLNRYIITFKKDGIKDITIKEAINHKEAMNTIVEENPGKHIVFLKWRNMEDMDTDGVRLYKK